jgi:WD40 repeat protein
VILWDFETATELARFTGHTNQVWNVAFATDGKTVFSAAYDGTVRQWRVEDQSLEELLRWIDDNRYVRDFTCEERAQHRIAPLCE